MLKAAQLPFRIDWQMHPALAPTPVSGYISSVLLKSAILGLIKLFMLLGGGFALAGLLSGFTQSAISTVVMWIGGVTIIMAALQALRTSGIKLMFIYSTVSQLGYMVLAVAAGGALGYAGGMLHVVNHVFFKDLLFLVCGAVMFASHRETLDDLGGLGRKMPFTLAMVRHCRAFAGRRAAHQRLFVQMAHLPCSHERGPALPGVALAGGQAC